jgi:hypothetical protein
MVEHGDAEEGNDPRAGGDFLRGGSSEKTLFGIPADAMASAAAHRVIVIDRGQVLTLFALLILAGALVWVYPKLSRLRVRIRQAGLAAKQSYTEGDTPAWLALRRAARSHSVERIVPALYRWMDRSSAFDHPARLDDIDTSSDPALEALVHDVRMRYSNHPGHPDEAHQARNTRSALGRLSRHARAASKTRSPLPPLNP